MLMLWTPVNFSKRLPYLLAGTIGSCFDHSYMIVMKLYGCSDGLKFEDYGLVLTKYPKFSQLGKIGGGMWWKPYDHLTWSAEKTSHGTWGPLVDHSVCRHGIGLFVPLGVISADYLKMICVPLEVPNASVYHWRSFFASVYHWRTPILLCTTRGPGVSLGIPSASVYHWRSFFGFFVPLEAPNTSVYHWRSWCATGCSQ